MLCWFFLVHWRIFFVDSCSWHLIEDSSSCQVCQQTGLSCRRGVINLFLQRVGVWGTLTQASAIQSYNHSWPLRRELRNVWVRLQRIWSCRRRLQIFTLLEQRQHHHACCSHDNHRPLVVVSGAPPQQICTSTVRSSPSHCFSMATHFLQCLWAQENITYSKLHEQYNASKNFQVLGLVPRFCLEKF